MGTDETLEEQEKKRKRLIFRSWHRGTREMDLLLGSFAEAHISAFSEDDLALYDDLLKCSDPDLYNAIAGHEPLKDEKFAAIMVKIKNFLDKKRNFSSG